MHAASKPQLFEAGLTVQPTQALGAEASPIFVGPIHELVAIGLCRSSLTALIAAARTPGIDAAAIERAAAPVDRGYLLRILDEEIGRQFGHPLRPIVELVLNAVDALRATRGPRVVDIHVSDGCVSVTDAGEGMTLRAVISKLLVPFATDKRPGYDIGRFGVGFFSVLGYGLSDPEDFRVHVDTSTGVESWAIEVHSNGRDVKSLICSVRPSARAVGLGDPGTLALSRGTSVTVTSSLLDAESVRTYLRDALHFFCASRAIIRLDGQVLNDGSAITGGRLYEDVAAPGPPPLTARFHLGGRSVVPGVVAATYHAGVKVETCLAIPELALIDFPSEVELTESRDALKPGPLFTSVAIAFYRRLARLGTAPGTTEATRRRLAEIAGQVSALMLQSAGWSETARDLARALLGPDRYLVSADRVDVLVGFIGADIADRLFVPESFWAERQWNGHLPGERELLDRELDVGPLETLDSVARRRPDLEGLAILAARASDPSGMLVSLARRRVPRVAHRGALACLGTRRGILLREDAPALRKPNGWLELYALRASFDRASGLREPEVERNLIVRDPMTFGG